MCFRSFFLTELSLFCSFFFHRSDQQWYVLRVFPLESLKLNTLNPDRLFAGILSKVLKKLVNQSRPEDCQMKDDSWLSVEPSDGGMPSSHAMSLGFIGTFTSLCLPQLTMPILLYVIVSLVYRIHSKLHTTQQVGVGLLVGTLNGYVWWRLCHGTLVQSVHVMNLVSHHLLVDGLLPWPFLAVPATLGLIVVGSFERRLSRWLQKPKES